MNSGHGEGLENLPVDNCVTSCRENASDASIVSEPDDSAAPVVLVDADECAGSGDDPDSTVNDLVNEVSSPLNGIAHPFFCVEVVVHAMAHAS